MKKKKILWIALFNSFFIGVNAQKSKDNKSQQSSIDSITELRTPNSLFELLHEGLNTVYSFLEKDALNSLDRVEAELVKLLEFCDNLTNTTRYNQVLNEDKEFLQAMIDRIDKLIADLEGDSCQKSTRKGIEPIKELILSLKEKPVFS